MNCYGCQELSIQFKIVNFSQHGISSCKLECIYMNCYGCQELLITPRKRAADCRECIEQYLNNKFKISQGNEVLVENIPAITHEKFCTF